jgi:hypothetical protein
MAGRSHTGNNRLYHEARKEVEARRSVMPLNVHPIDALQEVLDSTLADFRYAQDQVDRLEADGVFRETAQGTLPHEWIRLRDQYRDDLERMLNNFVRLGIAERNVRIQEAQATLIVMSLEVVAQQVGITKEQVRAMGAALREKLEQAAARELIEEVTG